LADPSIPLVIAVPIAVAMSGAIAAMWVKILADGRDARQRQEAWDKREQEVQEQTAELQARVTREVKRGAYLYAVSQLEPPKQAPQRPPAPDWDETTDVRNMRSQAELEALFRAYESTPPKQYRGKLPTHRD
jgi:hypothetical protein